MRTRINLQIRVTAVLAAMVLLLQPSVCAWAQAAEAQSGQRVEQQSLPAAAPQTASPEAAPAQPANDQLPDSPGALWARANNTNDGPQQPSDGQPAGQAPVQQPQNILQEPVGTAAAESMPTSGVAASRPAGAAVAPAKQRRARSILIKVGALVGAGVAVGTVMALSQGSPSKPPGSQ
jgi:hypothetical protein